MDVCCFVQGSKKDSIGASEGVLYRFFKACYAPFLMNGAVRAIVTIAFYGWLCTSIAVVPKIEVGLDQELSMPEDSHVLKYFRVRYPVFFSSYKLGDIASNNGERNHFSCMLITSIIYKKSGSNFLFERNCGKGCMA